jgi:hypothetical protein
MDNNPEAMRVMEQRFSGVPVEWHGDVFGWR